MRSTRRKLPWWAMSMVTRSIRANGSGERKKDKYEEEDPQNAREMETDGRMIYCRE